jgi:NADH-quinone oxidoreductase subunit L
LQAHWIEPQFRHLMPEEPAHLNWLMMLSSTLIAAAGIGLAYLVYGRQPSVAGQLARSMATLYEFSLNKFYFDELYELLIIRPMSILAHVCRIVDAYLIDGLVDLIGQLPAFLGFMVRPVQNGLVQFYALLMALGIAGFVLSVLLR